MSNKFLINKNSHKNFKEKINKKSSYLNHLKNQNSLSLKSLRSQKIDKLYDEMTENNKFKRNYLLFQPSTNKNKKISINNEDNKINSINNINSINTINNMEKNVSKKMPLLLPYLKIVMTSPNEKEYPEKYQKKNFKIDNFSGIYLKSKPISLHKIKQMKIENNSYKQNIKASKIKNSSEFYLPLVNKDHFLLSKIKNNQSYFDNINSFNEK